MALACTVLLFPMPDAQAQEDPPESSQPRVDEPPPRIDYDSEPPLSRYERYWRGRFPAAYSRFYRRQYYPYGRPYRTWSSWGADAYGWSPYGFNPYAYGAYPYYGQGVFDEGYVGGFDDGQRFQKWQEQTERGLRSYLTAMHGGQEAFRQADYDVAARQYMLAAKLNQGDAASRLHCVHAFTALGHYAEAVPALRRALQLQPKLVFLPLDIRDEYGAAGDFDAHLQQLTGAAQEPGTDAGLWLLLGYYQFFSGRGSEAVASLEKAAALAPKDSAVGTLLEAARLSAPVRRAPRAPPDAPPSSGATAL